VGKMMLIWGQGKSSGMPPNQKSKKKLRS